MIPSLKIVMSVVPPPISTKATPASFSSSLSTDDADAIGSNVISATSKSAFSTHFNIFRDAEICHVMI